MARLDLRRLEGLVHGMRGVKLLVTGDVMLDEHVWGEVDRVSPEAPVPVVQVRAESRALGGAGNVVRNIAALGGRCAFCAVVGDDAPGRAIRDLLAELDVDPAGLVYEEGRPTSHKTRVIARSQHVVRVDRETEQPITAASARRLRQAVGDVLASVSGVVLEDYGKGVLPASVIRALLRRFREMGLPVAVDPKLELAPYRGASLVKPNLREAEVLSGVRVRGRRDLDRAVLRMRRRVGPADFVITCGAEGLTIYEGERPGADVNTAAREVFDVQGAGDTTIAALALAQRAGATLFESAVIANAAAGVVVGKIGTAVAHPDEVCALLPAAIAAAEGST